jgi:predicted nuclease of predicted toxin-antitoxin system
MKVVLDMNISPLWVEFFAQYGIRAVHWSIIGDPQVTDRTILEWARTHDHIIFTHDLDFGTILAVTQADSPSVFQVRTQNILPERLGPTVLAVLQQFRHLLDEGALITVDEASARARILPLNR